MLYAQRIIFSLVCIVNFVLLAEQPPVQKKDNNDRITIRPLYIPEIPDGGRRANVDLFKQSFESTKKADILSEQEVEEMELVFESSPEKAQDIVKHLQDADYFPCSENYRAAFFVGESGSGKTRMAEIIAHKMTQEGWEYKIIPSTSFLGEYRNQTAIQLQKELEAIASSHKPTILIIDELHRLLENASSKHHDTDSTSTVLWTFLDKQAGNKNFFFIGTMNRINKLPKPLKDRMLYGYIPFSLITDSAFKNKLLRRNLTTSATYLDEEVTDVFLDEELEKIGPCSGRNLKLISLNILMMHKGNKEKRPVRIQKEYIARAMREYMHAKAAMEYDVEDETDEERQERHHKETMSQQEKYQQEQMQFQKEGRELDQKQLILQQRLQVSLAQYQHRLDHPSMYHLGTKRIDYLISEMEKNIAKSS
jgi:AAA+ superfamily predicted ATPase